MAGKKIKVFQLLSFIFVAVALKLGNSLPTKGVADSILISEGQDYTTVGIFRAGRIKRNLPTVTTTDSLEKSDIENLIAKNQAVTHVLKELKRRILAAHQDYSIAKTVGSSVSTVGAIATIVGIALIPVSGGWSLILSIGGLTGSVLGSGTTVTTGVVEIVKSKEWAKELSEQLEDLGNEYKAIGEKIVNCPTWKNYVKQAGSTGLYVAFKGNHAVTLVRLLKYFAITAPQYGLSQFPLKLYSATIPVGARFLLNENHIITRNLAKMGVGVSSHTLKNLFIGIGVVGIVLDVKTIVDTWVDDPTLAVQIDEIIENINKQVTDLEEFNRTF